MEIKLTLGFFFSVTIIGASFSFSEKMRYFADIGIGSGVLLLYGTLIYGSRTTDVATAMIPEVMSLMTSVVFTIAIAYFAAKRSSRLILIIGMIGAYITPFVIGQNEVWVQNVSFNAYLLYFCAVSGAMFLIGRDISIRDIIPLNMIGLFVGISTLWNLAYSDGIRTVGQASLFSSELFTGFMFTVLVIFSIWSILLSAKRFNESDDGYLSLGYIAPVIWFAFNITNLQSLSDAAVGVFYAVISVACFVGWHILAETTTKFQHTSLYASGLITAFLAIIAFFQDFDVATSMLLAYTSLIFAFLYLAAPAKSERFMGYIVVSLTGSVLSIHHILEANLPYETLLIVVALLPAMAAYFVAKSGSKPEYVWPAKLYSVLWFIVALTFVLDELFDYLDFDFLFFYLVPLIFLVYLAVANRNSAEQISYESRSRFLRLTLFWFALSFAGTFFALVDNLYPSPKDIYFFTHPELPTDWLMIKGLFSTAILFVGLWISRQLQLEQVIKRPSFILVIFGFSTLLLTGNHIISAIANDFGVPHVDGGLRALITTFWWATIAIFMLYKGIALGKKYHAEKLLGLMLFFITLIKIVIYDISTMGMQNKIVVLMVVGGAILLFSYFVRSKDLINGQST
jgi:hypothetical protein